MCVCVCVCVACLFMLYWLLFLIWNLTDQARLLKSCVLLNPRWEVSSKATHPLCGYAFCNHQMCHQRMGQSQCETERKRPQRGVSRLERLWCNSLNGASVRLRPDHFSPPLTLATTSLLGKTEQRGMGSLHRRNKDGKQDVRRRRCERRGAKRKGR